MACRSPTFRDCITAGVDLDDARRMAEEALALHLAGMAEDDEPIPEPSSLEALMVDRENRDAVAILVSAPVATTKAVRVNMTIPEDELEQIDKFAGENGYTRSGFLLRAAKEAIGGAVGRWTPSDLAAQMTRLEAEMNPANARAVLASVMTDDADPLKRLSELVEFSMLKDLQGAEAKAKAVEAKKAVDARRRTKGRK